MNPEDMEYYFSGFPRTLFEVFTIFYGVVIVNIYDCVCPRFIGYHFFLLFVYVLPFIPLLLTRRLSLWNIIWLGIMISLLNDLFFFFIARALGVRDFSIIWYYGNWLIPRSTYIGRWDFLLFKLDVYSWTMALSIYARLIFLWFTRDWRPVRQSP